MVERVLLEGDKVKAATWLPLARSELRKIKALGIARSHLRPVSSVDIRVVHIAGMDNIYIKAGKKALVGPFITTPHDSVSFNGWHEPFTVSLGTAVLWADTVQHRDSLYNVPTAVSDTQAWRHPKQVKYFSDGAKAGVNSWVGPIGECLSWKGTQNMIPDQIIRNVDHYTNSSYWDAEVFVGQEVRHISSNFFYRVVKAQSVDGTTDSGYSYEALFSSEIFYKGKLLIDIPASVYVTAASFRTDSTGRKWLQAIVGYFSTSRGIWREDFWTAPMSDLTSSTQTLMFTYITVDSGSGFPDLSANIGKWSFNESGTEAQIASREWYTTTPATDDRYRCKLEITDISFDPDIATPPTIVASQVERQEDNAHICQLTSTTTYTDDEALYYIDCPNTTQANRIGSASGTVTKSVNGGNYKILAIDYVGDTMVYAGVSTALTTSDSFSYSNTIGSVSCSPGTAYPSTSWVYGSLSHTTSSAQTETLFFSQNPTATVQTYGITSSSTTSLDSSNAGTWSGSGSGVTGHLGFIDPKHQIAEVIQDDYSTQTHNSTSAACTVKNYGARTRTITQKLYVGLDSTPETLFTRVIAVAASTPTISCWTTPYGDGDRFAYAWTPSSYTNPVQPNIQQSVVVAGINTYKKGTELMVMTSFPKGFAAYLWTFDSADAWDVRAPQEFYNSINSYTYDATTITLPNTVDLSTIEPLPDTTPRYIPITVTGSFMAKA